jgi:hypothetical protein
MILMIFEAIATVRHIIVNKVNSVLLILVWWFTIGTYVYFIYYCIRHKRMKMMFISLHFATFLLLIYHYILPTSLLMLVYPIKVIATLAYSITFVFAAITACALCVLFVKTVLKAKKHRICAGVGIIIFCTTTIIFILMLVTMFELVYALVSNQSANIAAAPVYTILSLIPPAAISFVTWMVKSKVFQLKLPANEHDTTEDTTEDSNRQRDTSDPEDALPEEQIPLLVPVEDDGASEPSGTLDRDNGGQDHDGARRRS